MSNFQVGDRVQLTDAKGKMHTITLQLNQEWHTHNGWLVHNEVIGLPEGSVVETTGGLKFLAFKPLLADYVLAMPRGATIVYPKDAAMILGFADIAPGSRVLEAGVGSAIVLGAGVGFGAGVGLGAGVGVGSATATSSTT